MPAFRILSAAAKMRCALRSGIGAPESQLWMYPRQNSADRKSTRLNSSHDQISYAVFCLKKKKTQRVNHQIHMTLANHYTPHQLHSDSSLHLITERRRHRAAVPHNLECHPALAHTHTTV